MSKIKLYIKAKEKLTLYKNLERQLRLEVLEELFPSAVNTKATTTSGNLIITGAFGLNHSLTSDFDYDSLSELEQSVISFKPSIIISAYKRLSEEQRTNLDRFVTVKPSLPTITIKESEECSQ